MRIDAQCPKKTLLDRHSSPPAGLTFPGPCLPLNIGNPRVYPRKKIWSKINPSRQDYRPANLWPKKPRGVPASAGGCLTNFGALLLMSRVRRQGNVVSWTGAETEPRSWFGLLKLFDGKTGVGCRQRSKRFF